MTPEFNSGRFDSLTIEAEARRLRAQAARDGLAALRVWLGSHFGRRATGAAH